MGRRFGSGFTTMCDGMPPFVTNVIDDGGKGTKVWRPLDVERSRRKCEGGIESSHSMEGLEKGKKPRQVV